jgi:hypothetical protein
MQDFIQHDLAERYKVCLEEFEGQNITNYSTTPFPIYFGSQMFIVNSKLFIFGFGESRNIDVKCLITQFSKNGLIELNILAINKLLHSLEDILRFTFLPDSIKTKIDLDDNVKIKFKRLNNENVAYFHDISRSVRLTFDSTDIKKLMMLYYPISIAVDRIARNSDELHEVYKAYIQLMSNKNTDMILSTSGIEKAIPESRQTTPY